MNNRIQYTNTLATIEPRTTLPDAVFNELALTNRAIEMVRSNERIAQTWLATRTGENHFVAEQTYTEGRFFNKKTFKSTIRIHTW